MSKVVIPDTVRVKMVNEDIQDGTQRSCLYCPIAKALKRQFPNVPVSVGSTGATVGNKNFNLSRAAQEFIRKFDSTVHVSTIQPRNFVISVE